MSPRRNKDTIYEQDDLSTIYESWFMNIGMRDSKNPGKMRIVKMIHAMVHKRVFLLFQSQSLFDEIRNMLTDMFDIQKRKTSS